MRQKIKRQARVIAAVNLAAGAGEIMGLWILHYLLKAIRRKWLFVRISAISTLMNMAGVSACLKSQL